MACAVRAEFPVEAGPMLVSAAFAVDLRPRTEPPIEPDAPYCCVSRQVSTTRVSAGDTPADVGRRIGDDLQSALARNEIQRRLVAQKLNGRPMALPPISYMVSNIGVVDGYSVPPGLRVTGGRWATTSRGPVPTLFGSTVGGSLDLELVYDTGFFRPELIEVLADRLEALLLAA
jgi:hypothetical protein